MLPCVCPSKATYTCTDGPRSSSWPLPFPTSCLFVQVMPKGKDFLSQGMAFSTSLFTDVAGVAMQGVRQVSSVSIGAFCCQAVSSWPRLTLRLIVRRNRQAPRDAGGRNDWDRTVVAPKIPKFHYAILPHLLTCVMASRCLVRRTLQQFLRTDWCQLDSVTTTTTAATGDDPNTSPSDLQQHGQDDARRAKDTSIFFMIFHLRFACDQSFAHATHSKLLGCYNMNCMCSLHAGHDARRGRCSTLRAGTGVVRQASKAQERCYALARAPGQHQGGHAVAAARHHAHEEHAVAPPPRQVHQDP